MDITTQQLRNLNLPRKPAANEYKVGLGVLLGLAAILFLFPTYIAFIFILLAAAMAGLLYFGSEYFPLALWVLLPFSVEVPVAANTNITLPTELLIPLLAVIWLVDAIINDRVRYRVNLINVPVIMLMVAMAASLIYSEYPMTTVKAVVRDYGYIFAGFYLLPLFLTNERRLLMILVGGLAAHLALALYGFITQLLGGIQIYGELAYPFFLEHCIYAQFVAFTFCFVLAYTLDMPSGTLRNFLWGLCAFFLVVIVLTFVRGSWLSLFPVLLFYLFHYRHKKGSVDIILIAIYIMLIGGVVVVGTGLGELLTSRALSITDLQQAANYDRLGRWFSAIAIWQDHPYFGAGWGTYPDMYFHYIIIEDTWSAMLRMGAHNLYLELLAEVGIVGLLIYLLLIYTFFREAILLQQRANSFLLRNYLIAAQGSMLLYLVHGFLNNMGPSDKISIIFWFLIGSMPSIRLIVEKQQSSASAG